MIGFELDDATELFDVDVVRDGVAVAVAVPVPTQSARSASPVRLANRPVSQFKPSQGFQACKVATVMLQVV